MAYYNGKTWVSSIPDDKKKIKENSTSSKSTSSSSTSSTAAPSSTTKKTVSTPTSQPTTSTPSTTAKTTNKTTSTITTTPTTIKPKIVTTLNQATSTSVPTSITVDYKKGNYHSNKIISTWLDINPFRKEERKAYKDLKVAQKEAKELRANAVEVRDTYDGGVIKKDASTGKVKYKVSAMRAGEYERVMGGLSSSGKTTRTKTIEYTKTVTKHNSADMVAKYQGRLPESITVNMPMKLDVQEVIDTPPNTEIWYITDGDSLRHVSNYSTGVLEIGRDRLEGIDADTRAVMYDKTTGKIYKFDTPDVQKANLEKRVNEINTHLQELDTQRTLNNKAVYDYAKANYGLDISTIDDTIQRTYNAITGGDPKHNWTQAELNQLTGMINRVDALTSDKEYQRLLTEYNATDARYNAQVLNKKKLTDEMGNMKGISMEDYREYLTLMEKANIGKYSKYQNMTPAEREKLSDLSVKVSSGDTTVYTNAAWRAQWNAMCDTVDKTRSEFEAEHDRYSDSISNTQVNSILDLARLAAAKYIFHHGDIDLSSATKQLVNRTILDPRKDILLSKEEFAESVNNKSAEAEARGMAKPVAFAAGVAGTIIDWSRPLLDENGYPIVSRDKYGAPVKVYTKYDEVKDRITKAGGMYLNNHLINLAETMDFTNAIFKPYLVGSAAYKDLVWNGADPENYDPTLRSIVEDAVTKYGTDADRAVYSNADAAGWEAFKTYWGMNGDLPSLEYDQLFAEDKFSNMLMAMALDIMFDPGTYFDLDSAVSVVSNAKRDMKSYKEYYKIYDATGDLAKSADAAKAALGEGKVFSKKQLVDMLNARKSKELEDSLLDTLEYSGIHIAADDIPAMRQYIKDEVTKMFKRVVDTDLPLLKADAILKSNVSSEYVTAAKNVWDKILKGNDTLKANIKNAPEYVKNSSSVFDDAIQSCWSKYNKRTADVAKSMPAKLDTSYKVVKSTLSREVLSETLNKTLFAAALPGISIPLATVKSIKFLGNAVLSKDVLGTVSAMSSRVSKKLEELLTTDNPLFTKDLRKVASELEDEISTAVGDFIKSGNTSSDFLKYVSSFSSGTFDSLVSDVLDKQFKPISDIFNDGSLSYADMIDKVDKWVVDNIPGYSTFDEYFSSVFCVNPMVNANTLASNNVLTLMDISPTAKQMIDSIKHEYDRINVLAKTGNLSETITQSEYAIDAIHSMRTQMYAAKSRLGLDQYTTIRDRLSDYMDTLRAASPSKLNEVEKHYKYIYDAIQDIEAGNVSHSKRLGISRNMYELEKAYKSCAEELCATYNSAVVDIGNHVTYKIQPIKKVTGKTDTAELLDTITNFIAEKAGVSPDVIDAHVVNETLITNADKLFNADGSIDLNKINRLYSVVTNKVTIANNVLNDTNLKQVVDAVLDHSTKDRLVLEFVKDIDETAGTVVDDFISHCSSVRNTKQLFDTIDNNVKTMHANDISDALVYSVKDAFVTPANSSYINYIVTNLDDTRDLTRAADSITDRLLHSASENINQKGDVPFYKFFDKNCNTVDTEANLKTMLNLINSESVDTDDGVMSIAALLGKDKDQYVDVYYSTTKSFEHSDPNMISFCTADGAMSTFRSDAPFAVKGESAFNLYGVADTAALAQWNTVASRIPALDADNYARHVEDYINEIYNKANAEGKTVRFIGFNSSDVYAESERYITQFTKNRAMGLHVSAFQDIADIMRKDKGFIGMPSNLRTCVRSAVYDSLNKLRNLDDVERKLAMNVNVDYTHTADVLSQNILRAPGLSAYTDEMLKTLNSVTVPIDTAFGTLINEQAICDAINLYANNPRRVTRVNCMELIGHITSADPFEYQLNVKTALNKRIMQDWFTEDAIKELMPTKAGPDAHIALSSITSNYDRVRRIVGMVESNYEKISDTTLLTYVGKDVLSDMYMYTMNAIIHNKKFNGIADMQVFSRLNLTNEFEIFSAYSAMVKRFREFAPTPKEFAAHYGQLALSGDESKRYASAILGLARPDYASDLVYGTTVKYNIKDVLVDPKHLKLSEDNNLGYAMLDELAAASRDVDDLGVYLSSSESMLRTAGINTPQEYMQFELYKPVHDALKDFVDDINAGIGDIIEKRIDNPLYTTSENVVRNKDITAVRRSIDDVQNKHKRNATIATFSLDDDEYAAHIIRNGLGGQLIDPNAKFMDDDTKTLMLKKLYSVSNSGLCKVEEIYKDTNGLWKVANKELNPGTKRYIRVTPTELINADADAIFAKYKDYNAGLFNRYINADISKATGVNVKFTDYLSKVSGIMPDSYFVSTLETMTQDTFKRFQEVFDVDSRLGGLNNAGVFNSWLDDAFNCSIIGDIDLIQQFNMYASDNIVNNISMGAHHVRKNLEATTNYFALATSPHTRLSNILSNMGTNLDIRKLDAGVIDKQITNRGFVIAAITGTEGNWNVEQLHLSAINKYKYVNDPNVMCVPNEVFMELQQYAKGVSKQWTYEHASDFNKRVIDSVDAWKRTFRAARTYAYLMVPFAGPGVRNMFDANWKAINQLGFGNYAYYAANAPEWNKGYVDILGEMLKGGNSDITEDLISEYFRKNPNTPISKELFTEIHTFKASSAVGLTDLYDLKNKNQVNTLQGLLREGSTLVESDINYAQRVYKSVYDKYYKKYKDMPMAKMAGEAREKLSKHYSGAELDDLTKLFYNYTANAPGWSSALADNGILGKYMSMNAAMFEAPETISRLGMYLYGTQELGYTANRANVNVIKTQFNYNARPKLIDKLEVLFPFSTYKIYNSLYWLNEAPKSRKVIQNANRITKAFSSGYDSEELTTIVRNNLMRQQIYAGKLNTGADGDLDIVTKDSTERGMIQMLHASGKTIEEYTGMSSLYADGIKLGTNHVIKLGNSYVEGIDFMASIVSAPLEIASGQVPTILGENFYSPFSTVLNAMYEYMAFKNGASYVAADSKDWFTKYVQNNHSDIADIVPFVGTLYNYLMSVAKNGNLNLTTLMLQNVLPNMHANTSAALAEAAWNVLGTVAPSLVGTLYDSGAYYDREVGYDWYNNTSEEVLTGYYDDSGMWVPGKINPDTGEVYTASEAAQYVADYKRTHRYVFGLSDFNYFLTATDSMGFHKDPATYFNYRGMYEAMGFSDEDISTMLQYLYGNKLSADGKYNSYYVRFDESGKPWFNVDAVNSTIEALVGRGYTIKAAMNLMAYGDLWFDPKTGLSITKADIMARLENSEFLSRYDNIPDYIKYDKRQYRELKEYYKSLGYSTEEIWALMQTAKGYITEEGKYVTLTDAQIKQYTTELNSDYLQYKNSLPDWFKYDSAALSRTTKYVSEMFPHMSMEQVYNYIVNSMFYVEEDGTGHKLTADQIKLKEDAAKADNFIENCPDYIRWESGAISRTLKYLMGTGLTNAQAKSMILGGAYYTVDGRLIDCTGLNKLDNKNIKQYARDAFKNSGYAGYEDFQSYYSSLPDAIKYTKGAFKRTNDALKDLGVPYQDRLKLIQQGICLIPYEFSTMLSANSVMYMSASSQMFLASGKAPATAQEFIAKYSDKVVTIDGKQYIFSIETGTRKRTRGSYYNSYIFNNKKYYRRNYYSRKKYTPRPKVQKPIRHNTAPRLTKSLYVTAGSYSSTYSKVNLFAGSSYGMRKIYKVELGHNPTRDVLSTKSAYPASYRNIVYGYRKNMYKDLYAKYGASRMVMRANASHGYSNAAVVRLRRNEIQNRVKYGNRRNNALRSLSVTNKMGVAKVATPKMY